MYTLPGRRFGLCPDSLLSAAKRADGEATDNFKRANEKSTPLQNLHLQQ